MELKKKIEALLFSSGKRMNTEEIAKLCDASQEAVKQCLTELKKAYDEKDSSLMLVEEGNFWKLTVREQYLPVVQKIVTETELSKTVIETLAVIAFKYPILQSDLIKIRTNKAYDHLNELEEGGYISRQKHGRTRLIKLTEKFFEYFDLPHDKLKDQFKNFESIAKAIEDKEKEIETIKEEQRKRAEEMKKEDEKIKQAAESVDEIPLETYESEILKEEIEKEEKPGVIVSEEKLGNLEVVDEPSEEDVEKDRERVKKIKEEDKKEIKEKKEKKKEKKIIQEKESVGIQLTEEMEKEVDRKVEEMLHPSKEENEEENKEEAPEQGKNQDKAEEEPKDLLEAAREEEDKKIKKVNNNKKYNMVKKQFDN